MTVFDKWFRCCLSGIASTTQWSRFWEQRIKVNFGPVQQLVRACQFLAIDWQAPTLLVKNAKQFSFAISDDLQGRASLETLSALRLEAKLNARLHDLRVFLHFAVASQEAARRPKDFGGLEGGLSEQRSAREHMYGAQLHFG